MIGNARFYTEMTARRKIKEVGDKHKISRKTAMKKITEPMGQREYQQRYPHQRQSADRCRRAIRCGAIGGDSLYNCEDASVLCDNDGGVISV